MKHKIKAQGAGPNRIDAKIYKKINKFWTVVIGKMQLRY